MYDNDKDKPKTIIGRKRPPASRQGTTAGSQRSSGNTQRTTSGSSQRQQSSARQQNGTQRSSQQRPRQTASQQPSSKNTQQSQNAGRTRQQQNRNTADEQQRRIRQAQPAGQNRNTQRQQRTVQGGAASSRTGAPRNTSGAKTSGKREQVYQEPVKKQKKPRHWTKRLARVLVVLLLVTGAAYAYLRYAPLNTDLSKNVSLYNISSNAAAMASSERIVNIAIFGVDGRSDVEGDRSDSIMVASADFEHNKLKITSLMRDTYVYNESEDDFDKLNAAYAIGGADLALKVINENFDMPITDYVTIDFTALVEMVNAVGGVEITVTDEDELYWINQYLWDVNDKVGTSDPDLTSIGTQTLTGSQALAYSRIRYTGNGDYDRTQRQRNVLQQVVSKAKALNPIALINLVNQTMPYIETSLSNTEIMKYIVNIIMMGSSDIEQFRLPSDAYVTDGMLDGVSYVFPMTLTDNIEAWYQFVYEKSYTPSSRAQTISQEIQQAWDDS